jgi:hypothetical protein
VLHRHAGDKMTEPEVVYRPLPRYSVPVIILVIILLITQCACGVAAEMPTYQAPSIKSTDILPTVVIANIETVNKDETDLQFTTSAPLHVRSCASVDCDVLAYLAAGSSVVVTVRGISGPGCAGAEWWAVEAGGVAGFVCSIYVTEAE